MFDFTVEVRDGGLNRLGQILPEDLNLTITERFNNVGEWKLTLPIGHPLVPALRTPGAGIIVTVASGALAGTTLVSGPMVSPEVTTSASDPGTVTIAGATDNVLLSDRLAHPAPSTLDPTAATHHVIAGPAESVMQMYVAYNLSALAHPTRADSRVHVPDGLNRGAITTQRARFAPLGALVATIAAGADYPASRESYHPGHLGFRLVQVGSTLEFQVYEVADRSAEVRLDVHNGTLASHKVTTAAPTVTNVIVAGEGEGTDRAFVERTTPEATAAATAWRRRIELLKDQRQTSEESELETAGDAELAEGGLSQYAMEVVPGDDTAWEFGTDWNLGDIVSVVVRDGGPDQYAASEYATVVTGYILKADASGTRMGAVLGKPREDDISRIERRLSNLEANAEGGAAAVDTGIPTQIEVLSANESKGYRLRTSGALLDFEAGGSSLYLSTWSNADYTGSQWTKAIFPAASGPVMLPEGASSWAQPTADDHLVRRDYLETRHTALAGGSMASNTWYRVASFGTGDTVNFQARANAQVIISSTGPSRHDEIIIDLSLMHNSPTGTTMNLVNYGGYSSVISFVQARLVFQATGAYAGAHLEIKTSAAAFSNMYTEIRVQHREPPISYRWMPQWTAVAATPPAPSFVAQARGLGYAGDFVSPALQNGWLNYSASFNDAGYRMLPGSRVELRGLLRSGTLGSGVAAFTLPVGYRPIRTELRAISANNAIGRVDITPAGLVCMTNGSTSYMSIDGLVFLAEQ